MNGVDVITTSKYEATQQYRAYRQALVKHPLPYVRDLKNAYNQLRRGHGVIDVFKAFSKAGVNVDGEPKLALHLATETTCYFHKTQNGSGYFGWNNRWDRRKPILNLAEDTFPQWKTGPSSWNPKQSETVREVISCKVPIVPVNLLPTTHLNNFHILWEVEKWTPEPPKDPMLLRRLSVNLFAVVASWDLTELERAVIAGRIR